MFNFNDSFVRRAALAQDRSEWPHSALHVDGHSQLKTDLMPVRKSHVSDVPKKRGATRTPKGSYN